MKHFDFLKSAKQTFMIIMVLLTMQNHCFSQYTEGDTASFWSVTYNDWPPLIGSPQRLIQATCKKSGSHCYVFTENNIAQPSQANMDSLVSRFDHHWYDSLTTVYGPVPNVFDNDPKVIILVFNESDWWGYFDPGQQMPDTMVYRLWERHSNQREIIYVSSTASNNFDDVVPHEFGHMLHWQQDHSPEPVANPTKYWEDAWVDEGFSTFAEIYLTENIYEHNIMDNEAFFTSNPDIPLIYFSNYNQVKLFMLFMYEHYGHWNYISSLISNQLNGISGVASTLSQLGYTESFDDVFEQWALANCVDDTLYENGKYSYAHYNFASPLISNTHNTFPTSIISKTINPFGVDYILFSSTTPKPLTIDFSGQLNSKFRVDLILKNKITNLVDSIISVPLDASNHATFELDSLGSTYNKAILMVVNLDSTIHEGNTASYNYSATIQIGVNEEEKSENTTIFPNPADDILNITLNKNITTGSKIELFDITGRLIFTSSINSVSNTAIVSLKEVKQGLYLCVIKNGEDVLSSFKLSVVKQQ